MEVLKEKTKKEEKSESESSDCGWLKNESSDETHAESLAGGHERNVRDSPFRDRSVQ